MEETDLYLYNLYKRTAAYKQNVRKETHKAEQ